MRTQCRTGDAQSHSSLRCNLRPNSSWSRPESAFGSRTRARWPDARRRNCWSARMLARVRGWSAVLDTRRTMVARERRHVSMWRRGRVRIGNCLQAGASRSAHQMTRVLVTREGRREQPARHEKPAETVAWSRMRASAVRYPRDVEREWVSATAHGPRLLAPRWRRGRRGYARSALANPADASASPHSRSSGLRTPSAPRFRTCKYTIVVDTSAWPSSSCTARMS